MAQAPDLGEFEIKRPGNQAPDLGDLEVKQPGGWSLAGGERKSGAPSLAGVGVRMPESFPRGSVENPINEQSKQLGFGFWGKLGRGDLMNYSGGNPEVVVNTLKKQGIDAVHRGEFRFAIKDPDGKWRRLEREGGFPEFQDITDVGGGVLSTLGAAGAAAPFAFAGTADPEPLSKMLLYGKGVAAAAAAGGAIEAGLQATGKARGMSITLPQALGSIGQEAGAQALGQAAAPIVSKITEPVMRPVAQKIGQAAQWTGQKLQRPRQLISRTAADRPLTPEEMALRGRMDVIQAEAKPLEERAAALGIRAKELTTEGGAIGLEEERLSGVLSERLRTERLAREEAAEKATAMRTARTARGAEEGYQFRRAATETGEYQLEAARIRREAKGYQELAREFERGSPEADDAIAEAKRLYKEAAGLSEKAAQTTQRSRLGRQMQAGRTAEEAAVETTGVAPPAIRQQPTGIEPPTVQQQPAGIRPAGQMLSRAASEEAASKIKVDSIREHFQINRDWAAERSALRQQYKGRGEFDEFMEAAAAEAEEKHLSLAELTRERLLKVFTDRGMPREQAITQAARIAQEAEFRAQASPLGIGRIGPATSKVQRLIRQHEELPEMQAIRKRRGEFAQESQKLREQKEALAKEEFAFRPKSQESAEIKEALKKLGEERGIEYSRRLENTETAIGAFLGFALGFSSAAPVAGFSGGIGAGGLIAGLGRGRALVRSSTALMAGMGRALEWLGRQPSRTLADIAMTAPPGIRKRILEAAAKSMPQARKAALAGILGHPESARWIADLMRRKAGQTPDSTEQARGKSPSLRPSK